MDTLRENFNINNTSEKHKLQYYRHKNKDILKVISNKKNADSVMTLTKRTIDKENPHNVIIGAPSILKEVIDCSLHIELSQSSKDNWKEGKALQQRVKHLFNDMGVNKMFGPMISLKDNIPAHVGVDVSTTDVPMYTRIHKTFQSTISHNTRRDLKEIDRVVEGEADVRMPKASYGFNGTS
jgi:hypothetical protein